MNKRPKVTAEKNAKKATLMVGRLATLFLGTFWGCQKCQFFISFLVPEGNMSYMRKTKNLHLKNECLNAVLSFDFASMECIVPDNLPPYHFICSSIVMSHSL
jgi:hypothetical protein